MFEVRWVMKLCRESATWWYWEWRRRVLVVFFWRVRVRRLREARFIADWVLRWPRSLPRLSFSEFWTLLSSSWLNVFSFWNFKMIWAVVARVVVWVWVAVLARA